MTVFAVGLSTVSAQADNYHKGPYSPEEQKLVDRGDVVEIYQPQEPSGHRLGSISPAKGPKAGQEFPVVFINFGREDAEAARAEARSMAEFRYTRKLAEQFIFAEGWDKYHDRFFTRAYIQEAEDAYNKAIR